MRWLQLFFYSVIFLSVLFADAVTKPDTGDFHICYFSLNNEKEFTEMEKFTDRLNKHSHCSISVNEYLTEGDDPEESFKKMVESGVRCDGLVISGHHTGSFGGKRSHGSLNIDFLEKLSCDERYSKWFNNINALWLQGCRTLGTGEIVQEEQEVDADYHTTRVGDVLEADHLEQSFADLNMEFSATLDQDNPLSSRYLRTFPGATVFGWTKTAPGERSGSQYSIPFHMAHISRLINNQDGFPTDSPIKGTWTKDSAVEYGTAMLNLLNGESQCEELAVEAWKEHGRVRDQSTEYGFFNPDLNAYTALMNTDDEVLKQARIYDCLFKHSDGDKLLEVLDLILKDQTFIRYTYNSLLERLKQLKKEDPVLHSKMVEKLKKSKKMREFLNKKLTGKRLGILRKIDYYAFYEEIYGENESIRSLILDKASEAFEKIPSNTFDQRDYKETLLSSLSKHGYLNNDRGVSLLTKVFKDSDAYVRRVAVKEAGYIGEKGLPILEQGIKDSDKYVRMAAVELAGNIGEKGLPILEQGIKDSDIICTDGRQFELARYIGEKGLPILEQGIKDSDKYVRMAAVEGAGNIGEKGLPILEQGMKDSEYSVRLEAVELAGYIGEKALPMVNRVFKHSDKYIRVAAVRAAGNIGEKGLPIIEQGIKDSEYSVKLEAVRAAGEIGNREKALLFLEKAGGLPLLKKGIKDPAFYVRETAIKAAASIGEKGLPILEQGIKDIDEYVRETAVWESGKIGKKGLPILEQGIKDIDEYVRMAAVQAAGEMVEEGIRRVDEIAERGAADAGEVAEKMAEEIVVIKTTVSILKQGFEDSEIGVKWESEDIVRDIEDEIRWILDGDLDNRTRIKMRELRNYMREAF